MIRIRISAVAALSILVAATAPVFSQQGQGSPFVTALLSQLSSDGWSAQDTSALSDAAASLDWSGTQSADPQVVAFALEMAKSRDQQFAPAEEAQLAVQLALSATDMSSAGFDSHAVADAALAAVRIMQSEIQAWKAGGKQGNLGQLIRNAVSLAVRAQVQGNAGGQSAGGGPGGPGGQGQAGQHGNGPPPWAQGPPGGWPPQRP